MTYFIPCQILNSRNHPSTRMRIRKLWWNHSFRLVIRMIGFQKRMIMFRIGSETTEKSFHPRFPRRYPPRFPPKEKHTDHCFLPVPSRGHCTNHGTSIFEALCLSIILGFRLGPLLGFRLVSSLFPPRCPQSAAFHKNIYTLRFHPRCHPNHPSRRHSKNGSSQNLVSA